MKTEPTGWEITGASGATITAGTPIARIAVGLSRIELPIENPQTGEQALVTGNGVGMAGSIDGNPSLFSLSGSAPEFPADGIGHIVRGPAAPEGAFEVDHFDGDLMVLTLGAGAGVGGTLSAAAWLALPAEACIREFKCSRSQFKQIAINTILRALGSRVPLVRPVAQSVILSQRIKAAGLFAGTVLQSSASLSTDLFMYGADAEAIAPA